MVTGSKATRGSIRAPARIMEAAREEFAVHGIDNTRITEIVRRAGVSKQLFYYYFKSKEEIYEIVLEQAAEQALSLILAQDYTHESAESALVHLLHSVFDQYLGMPALVQFTLDQDHHGGMHISKRNKLRSLSPILIDLFHRILQRGAATGEFKIGIDPVFFYTATLLMLRGCFTSSTAFIAGSQMTDRSALLEWRNSCVDWALAAARAPVQEPSALPSHHIGLAERVN